VSLRPFRVAASRRAATSIVDSFPGGCDRLSFLPDRFCQGQVATLVDPARVVPQMSRIEAPMGSTSRRARQMRRLSQAV